MRVAARSRSTSDAPQLVYLHERDGAHSMAPAFVSRLVSVLNEPLRFERIY